MKIKTYLICLLAGLTTLISLESQAQGTMMGLPAHSSIYSSMVRGYWFTAPVSFTITGLKVAPEAGTGLQYIHVMKCNGTFPIAFGSPSTAFTTLTYISGGVNNTIIPVNISVQQGDQIGILGSAGTGNSYTASAVHTSTLAGQTVTLSRLGYQGNIDTGPAPNYWGVGSTESGALSRVFMYYTTSSPTDAGLESFVFPSDTTCNGTQDISVTLKNHGPNALSTVKIGCRINSDSITTYNWSGNLAANSTTNVVIGTYNFQAGQTYSLKAFTRDPNAAADTNKINDTILKSVILVKPRPTATPTSTSYSMCAGDSVQISGTFTGTPPWNMTVLAGSTPNTFSNLTSPGFSMYVSPSSTTTYTVSSLTDSGGCIYTSTPPIVVTVNPLPAANTGGNKQYCIGGSTVLGTTAVSGNTYLWSPATGLNNATVSNPIANPTVTTTYTLTETKTSTGCVKSNSTVVSVHPIPVANAGSNQVLTTGSITTLNGSATGGLSPYHYSWAPANLLVNANVQNPTTVAINFSTMFTLTVTDSISGCSDTDNVTITISGGPIFSIASATPTGICTGSSSQLNLLTSGGTGTYTYTWSSDPPGFTSASIPNPLVSPTVTTKYYVLISDGTLNRTDSITVTVYPNPPAVITPAGSTNLCQGSSVVLNAPTGTGFQYKWFKDNVQISGATSSSYTANTAGSYVLQVTNSTNCSSTSSPLVIVVNPNPLATITAGGSLSICTGDSVKLATNNAAGLTWQWRLNAVNISGATDSVYYAKQSGTFSVLVTNVHNCSTLSANQTVTVNPIPNALITPAGSTTICAGSSLILNANSGAGQTYKWYKDGVLITGAVSSSYTATQPGSYTLQVTSSANCSQMSTAVVVSQHLTPTSSISATGALGFCQGDSVLLTATTDIGTSWQWRRDGVSITGATASTYWAKITGVYTAVASNTNCNVVSNAITVTVTSLPIAAIYPGGSTNLCPGGTVLLNASSGTGYTHQWKKDGTNITGATNSYYLASAAGSYVVVITANGTCTATSPPEVVTMNPAPTATLSPAGPFNFCTGDSVVLSATIGTGYTYLWKRDNITIIGANTSSYTAKQQGTYTVIITNNISCTATSNAVVVNVLNPPPATITPQGATAICPGESVTLNANTGTGLTYQWYKDGTAISGAVLPIYIASQAGAYTVKVSNAVSCSNTSSAISVSHKPQPSVNLGADQQLAASKSLTLDAGAGFASYSWSTGANTQTILVDGSLLTYGPHPFSVTVTNAQTCSNADTVVVTVIDDTGIENANSNNTFEIYPNPTRDEINIRINGLKGAEAMLQIFDLSAKLIMENNIVINQDVYTKKILISLTPGVYILKINGNQINGIRRIVVE